jgi:DNA modification methylase
MTLNGEGVNFLELDRLPDASVRGIITNPPYEQAEQFCAHALKLTQP